MHNKIVEIVDEQIDIFCSSGEVPPNYINEIKSEACKAEIYFRKAINLLYGYNQMVKTDPQYKLNKPYSPKTDIDGFFEMDEIKEIVDYMVGSGEIVRKSKLEDFGDYEKVEYLVELLNGEVVNCYPNAGLMNATDGSGRLFNASHVWSFKVNPESEC